VSCDSKPRVLQRYQQTCTRNIHLRKVSSVWSLACTSRKGEQGYLKEEFTGISVCDYGTEVKDRESNMGEGVSLWGESWEAFETLEIYWKHFHILVERERWSLQKLPINWQLRQKWKFDIKKIWSQLYSQEI